MMVEGNVAKIQTCVICIMTHGMRLIFLFDLFKSQCALIFQEHRMHLRLDTVQMDATFTDKQQPCSKNSTKDTPQQENSHSSCHAVPPPYGFHISFVFTLVTQTKGNHTFTLVTTGEF